jgi:tetratricopeptide (TPR) repeat protein
MKLEASPQASQSGFLAAKGHYDEALRLQQDLVAGAPKNDAYRQELARTYYNRGILHYDLRQFDTAEADFREAIGRLEPLGVNSDGQSGPAPAQEMARACNNLANLLLGREERLGESLELFNRAIGILEGLRKRDPENREYKTELAQYYNNLANLLEYRNQLGEARRRNQQALDLIEDLAGPVPALAMERARAHYLRGVILKSERPAEAEKEFALVLDQMERMAGMPAVGGHPQFRELYAGLGDYFAARAERGLKSGRPAEVERAMASLARVLPSLPSEELVLLEQTYPELRGRLLKIPLKRRREP